MRNATWVEYVHEGPAYCLGDCGACVDAARDGVLVRSGWVVPACDAGEVFGLTLSARGREHFASSTSVELVAGGELLDLVVTEEQLETEAPELPHASLRASYRQHITDAGRALFADLGCAAPSPPEVCQRLADVRSMDFYASYHGGPAGWSVVRADEGAGHAAGGLHWN